MENLAEGIRTILPVHNAALEMAQRLASSAQEIIARGHHALVHRRNDVTGPQSGACGR
jgi:hypothetical protein